MSVLERLRILLGVDCVSLSRIEDDGIRLLAACGTSENHLALTNWQALAAAADAPLIIADLAQAGHPQKGLRFFAGIKLPAADNAARLLLSLSDRSPRSLDMAYQLAALVIDVTSRAIIARQASQIEQQRVLAEQQQALFNRASTNAKIGMWSCTLPEQWLDWSDSVYDMFELPRGTVLQRHITVHHYTPQSRIVMETARAKAIADGSDFSVDVEIVTAKGTHRWIRLTGSVETTNGVATRIFGMKQDITEEKLLADQTRYLAETDVVTGLANRGKFQTRISDLSGERHGAPIGALLLIDLDWFKQINDNHGHALGDECLKVAAVRLRECCAGAALVARIGGDEFAVLLAGPHSVAELAELTRGIVSVLGQPFVTDDRTIALSASVGAAQYLAGTPDDLFSNADFALYEAKAAGRNTSRLFSR